jgi:spermidine synthase
LLELASPAPLPAGRLRLLEPTDSSESTLLQRLIEGSYDKPFIQDCGPLRYLHFDLDDVQSVMRHDDPDALCLAYTRKMMAFLLFNPEPRRVLLLGLGGGSLAKFCYRHLPGARITALEIDPHVLALREEFQVPPDDERFRVVQGDGVEYIARRGRTGRSRSAAPEDVILVDACDRNGLSPTLSSPELYTNLSRRLSADGVLVMNVCGEELAMENHLGRIRGVFGDRLISLPAREDGNLIVLGFKKAPPTWDGAELDRYARKLEQRFGLAFPRYARQMTCGCSPLPGAAHKNTLGV